MLIVYMASKKAQVNHTGYVILEGMPDSLLSTSGKREGAGVLIEYFGIKLEKLFESVISTFPGKAYSKSGKNCTLRNPIFNKALYMLDFHGSDGGVAGYSSTNKLLTAYLEKE